MFTPSTVVHEVLSSKRPQRAVIVSPRRPVRQALAVALAEAGFEVISCNVPAQVLSQPDGRLRVSLMHTGPEALPVTIRARRLPR